MGSLLASMIHWWVHLVGSLVGSLLASLAGSFIGGCNGGFERGIGAIEDMIHFALKDKNITRITRDNHCFQGISIIIQGSVIEGRTGHGGCVKGNAGLLDVDVIPQSKT